MKQLSLILAVYTLFVSTNVFAIETNDNTKRLLGNYISMDDKRCSVSISQKGDRIEFEMTREGRKRTKKYSAKIEDVNTEIDEYLYAGNTDQLLNIGGKKLITYLSPVRKSVTIRLKDSAFPILPLFADFSTIYELTINTGSFLIYTFGGNSCSMLVRDESLKQTKKENIEFCRSQVEESGATFDDEVLSKCIKISNFAYSIASDLYSYYSFNQAILQGLASKGMPLTAEVLESIFQSDRDNN